MTATIIPITARQPDEPIDDSASNRALMVIAAEIAATHTRGAPTLHTAHSILARLAAEGLFVRRAHRG